MRFIRQSVCHATLIGVLLVTGCANDPNAQKQQAGTVIGGVAGALLGSQFGGGTGKLLAVGVGTLAGAMIGSEIGRSMDKADQDHYRLAQQQASSAPLNQPIQWNNPDNGHRGTVTAINDGRDGNGYYCRKYRSSVWIDNRPQETSGTACQQPDGTWKVVN